MHVSQAHGLELDILIQRVADHTDDVILITEAEPIDAGGPRIVYVNPAFTRLTGYTPGEVIGLTPRLLQGPKTSRDTCNRIRQALLAWKPIRVELLNYRKDGSEFWIELHITPVADSAGFYRYWLAVQRDISERRQLDEQRRLYDLVLSHVQEGIVVVDALQSDHPIEYANDGFLRMSGYSREEVIGRNCRFMQGPSTDPYTTHVIRNSLAVGRPLKVEVLNYRRDRTSFWNLLSITPLRDSQGDIVKYVGVQHDLTDTKLREQEMVASQRLKTIGELTGGIAHDFNNLLTSITGASEILASRLSTDPELSALVGAIRGAASRGTSQVRRLLGFSRTPMLARGKVDVQKVLHDLAFLMSRSLRDNITFQVEVNPDARWVDAESVQLEAALANLVLNAQDAITGPGTISISTSLVTADGKDMVLIETRDTGCGMDQLTLSRIFEPFYTTKEQGRGSGLGLAMVLAFAKQVGGNVSVISEIGKGSTFSLTLPATEPDNTSFAELEQPPPRPSRPATVLLVEDDEVVSITAIAMVQALGHSVQACANADHALAVLETDQNFDVLFTDVVMPGSMGGIELAQEARRRRPGISVILASGWADTHLPSKPADSAYQRFLLKPYTLQDLARAFSSVLP